jgi:hypothetical protein
MCIGIKEAGKPTQNIAETFRPLLTQTGDYAGIAEDLEWAHNAGYCTSHIDCRSCLQPLASSNT